MKTRIKKIIVLTAAMLFVGSGLALAHDWNDREHKPPGTAYGHYQAKKMPPGWSNKNFKPAPPKGKQYVYREVRDHHYYVDHGRRPVPPREDTIVKVALKDPLFVFKIIVKDHR